MRRGRAPAPPLPPGEGGSEGKRGQCRKVAINPNARYGGSSALALTLSPGRGDRLAARGATSCKSMGAPMGLDVTLSVGVDG
jgi:hypothetical protein